MTSIFLISASPAGAQSPGEAFELLKEDEQEHAGDPEFDYRLGTAALAANKPVDAVFALSRAVAREPANVSARIALARAYVRLDDLASARRQLGALASADGASQELAATLGRYVTALDAALARREATLGAALIDADYVRAVALLDAARPAEAEQVLAGLLAREPDHLPARAELGRAHAMQGDYAAARRELALVAQDENLPDEVRGAMGRYIAALDTNLAGRRTRFDGYVELTAGYDSNVNNATDEERILIPLFSSLGLATLSREAQGQEDGFAQAAGRLSVVHRVSDKGRLLADLSASLRRNFEHTRFDQAAFGGSIGYGWDTEVGAITVAGQAQTFFIDGDAFRNAFGALAGWTRKTKGGTDLSANLQYTWLDFPDNGSRDAHRIAAGFSGGHPVGQRTYLFGGVYAGREKAADSRFDRLSQWFFGARAGVEEQATRRLTLSGTALAERQVYDEEEPLFLAERRTWRFDVRLRGRYRLNDRLSLVTGAGYTRATSNIVLFDYDRFTAWTGVELEF